MPRLSIVIPVLGEPQQLDETLLSVLENRPADCEILVVHNRPYHDPYKLGDEVQFIPAERGAAMAECLNRGLAASSAPVVHILTCGVQVCSGWANAALRHFGNPDIAAVGAVVLNRDDRRKIISAGLGYRTEGTAWRLEQFSESGDVTAGQQDFCGPDTMAAFYRRSAVQSLGGLSSWAGDSLAGIDLALALRHAGFRCVLEPQCVTHVDAAATYVEPAFRRGRNIERLFWRWAWKQGGWSSLAAHVALLASQCVSGLWRPSLFAQLAGQAWGALQVIFARGRRRATPPAPGEKPSVIAAPHFNTLRIHKEQRSSRVA